MRCKHVPSVPRLHSHAPFNLNLAKTAILRGVFRIAFKVRAGPLTFSIAFLYDVGYTQWFVVSEFLRRNAVRLPLLIGAKLNICLRDKVVGIHCIIIAFNWFTCLMNKVINHVNGNFCDRNKFLAIRVCWLKKSTARPSKIIANSTLKCFCLPRNRW